LAIDQIRFARNYTNRLLDQTKDEDWCRMPPGAVSHVAWQAGHLTVAQYRLALARIRGQRPQDTALVPEDFLNLFRRQSVPDPDAGTYPDPRDLRALLGRVHEQVLRETGALDESELDKPGLFEHPLAHSKLDSLFWCAHHEMLHSGQI